MPTATFLDADGLNQYHQGVKQLIDDLSFVQNQSSKNLLPNVAITASSTISNGITFIVNANGSITASGTATNTAFFNVYSGNLYLHNGSYIMTGCPSGGHNTTSAGVNDNYLMRVLQRGAYAWESDIGNGLNLTISNEGITDVVIRIASGTNLGTGITFYPMIRFASVEDDEFVEYAKTNTELTNRTYVQDFKSKNLLQLKYPPGYTYTRNGLTYTFNDDGTIKVNGTCTGLYAFAIADMYNYQLPAGSYIISGCYGGAAGTYKLQADYFDNSNVEHYAADPITDGDFYFSFPNSGETYNGHFTVYMAIAENQVMNNFIFYPMIRLSAQNSDSTFVPYAKTNVELSQQFTTASISCNLSEMSINASGFLEKDAPYDASKWQVVGFTVRSDGINDLSYVTIYPIATIGVGTKFYIGYYNRRTEARTRLFYLDLLLMRK